MLSVNPDGSDERIIATGCRLPDGIAVDVEAGHLYWTNMGVPSRNDGSIERADLDGRNRKTIVPEGGTFTPKQLQLDKRERQALLVRPRRHARDAREPRWLEHRDAACETGIDRGRSPRPDEMVRRHRGRRRARADLLDAERSGQRRSRAHLPRRASTSRRARAPPVARDIEVLFDGLPEPIDLEIDLAKRLLYWTDRGDPPRGNTVNRAPLDAERNGRPAPEIVFTHLMEGIGIALDREGGRMFITDLAGSVYSAQARRLEESAAPRRPGQSHRHRIRRNTSSKEHDMNFNKPIRRIAIVGTGVIGASWAAQYLARGFDVVATDPAPNAEANLRKYVDEAWADAHEPSASRRAPRATA